jgi:hypothetical protein
VSLRMRRGQDTPSRATVRENERGELAVTYRGRPLRFSEIATRPERPIPPRLSVSSASRGRAAPSAAIPRNEVTSKCLHRFNQQSDKQPGDISIVV